MFELEIILIHGVKCRSGGGFDCGHPFLENKRVAQPFLGKIVFPNAQLLRVSWSPSALLNIESTELLLAAQVEATRVEPGEFSVLIHGSRHSSCFLVRYRRTVACSPPVACSSVEPSLTSPCPSHRDDSEPREGSCCSREHGRFMRRMGAPPRLILAAATDPGLVGTWETSAMGIPMTFVIGANGIKQQGLGN